MKLVNTRSMMSDAKFFESYSRFIDGKYESWTDSVSRVMDMHRTKYAEKMTPELEVLVDRAENAYSERRVLGAQRALQFGGDQMFSHNVRMFNCVTSYADRPAFFGEFMYVLLCGAGAGFSIQRHHTENLPILRTRGKRAKTFVVPDSVEGWSQAIDVLLSSFFVGGGKHPEYEGCHISFDLSKIRPKGAVISGGFKAPGPDPLRKALDLTEKLVLKASTEERQLRPIEVYDICMYAADAVISGGVRRSATIALFDLDDQEMLNAKTGDWFMENPQRARSNNSAIVLRDEITWEEFHAIMETIKQFGEPGFIFTDNKEFLYNP